MRPFSHRSFYYLGMVLLILLFGGNACRASNPTPQSVHFTPSLKSIFGLQFDYPAEWKSEFSEGDDWAQLNIYDPTKLPPNADLTYHSDNFIVITVIIGDNMGEHLDVLLDLMRSTEPTKNVRPDCENCISPFNDKTVDTVILEDKATEIAGYPAHHFSSQFTIVIGEERKTYFQQSLFILDDDRLYTFDLSMLADEKDGPFGKGFEYMLSTIRPYP